MATTIPIFKDFGKIGFVIDQANKDKYPGLKVGSEVSSSDILINIFFRATDKVPPKSLKLSGGGFTETVINNDPLDVPFSFQIPLEDLEANKYTLKLTDVTDNANQLAVGEFNFIIEAYRDATSVRLGRPGIEPTMDKELWTAIKEHSINFKAYSTFIERIMCKEDTSLKGPGGQYFSKDKRKHAKNRSPFIGAREYNLLKFGTEFYMLAKSALSKVDVSNYMGSHEFLPYYEHISDTLADVESEYGEGECAEVKEYRLNNPFFIELIWSYWMEQGMLMQAMNLITLRFQNIDNGNLGQLARFDLSPLRPLSQLLWGFVQDEQHRLSLPRRVREYDHEYGLSLTGKAVPAFVSADSRSKFLEAFHNLLTTTSLFFKEADDTTRIADAFPVLNCLKEVHLLLAEGNHNAYGNLTWTARHEMMMTQYIISREETRIFLGGRPMVPYPENWMDRLDVVRGMMGWGNTSITYFYDLAIHGEKVLLGIRYGNWSDATMPVTAAANWALAFRDSIQKYIHGYRTVTGVDLSADSNTGNSVKLIQPSILIQKRLAEERSRLRRA
jgi:hypothetical protein